MLPEAIVFAFGVMRLWQQRHAIVVTSVRIVMQTCCHGSSKLHISEHSVCYMVVLLAMRPMLYGLR